MLYKKLNLLTVKKITPNKKNIKHLFQFNKYKTQKSLNKELLKLTL